MVLAWRPWYEPFSIYRCHFQNLRFRKLGYSASGIQATKHLKADNEVAGGVGGAGTNGQALSSPVLVLELAVVIHAPFLPCAHSFLVSTLIASMHPVALSAFQLS